MPTDTAPAATFELAVVGTGIVGAATAALAAVRDPDASIAVLCAGSRWETTTARSLAVDIPAGGSAAQRAVARRSLELREAVRTRAASWAAGQYPSYWLMSGDAVPATQEQLIADRLEPCDVRQHDDIRSTFGDMLGGPGSVLLRSGPAAVSDPVRTVGELLAPVAAGPRNRLVEHFTVERIDARRGGFQLTAEDGRQLRARRVVAAPGAWALRGPFRRTAAKHAARTKKIVAFRLTARVSATPPLLNLEDHGAFVLPGPAEGSWWLSITSNDWDCLPDHRRVRADQADLAEARRVLDAALPRFGALIVRSRVGVDLYPPERGPLVTALEEQDGAVLATGCAGSGFRLAPGIAERALDLVGFPGPSPDPAHPRPLNTASLQHTASSSAG